MKRLSNFLIALALLTASFLSPIIASDVFADTPQHVFNGKAWFIWNCDGDLCRYKIEGLTSPTINPVTEDITYTTKYIKASDVVDRDDASKTLNLNALLAQAASVPANALAPYLFVFDDCIVRNSTPDNKTCIAGIDGITTWSSFQTWWEENIAGDYDTQKDFAIDPTGASAGKNIISTNGDRNFRATIYDETDYYGISNASSTADLTYYPFYWNTAFFNPAYDVSETTLENPKIIQSFLLEPQVVLKNDDISGEITSLTVASPNIPATAVTITKQNDGSYKIVFNSNYYDKIIFRVTSGGKSYYVAIARTVVGHNYERSPVLYVPEGDVNEYDVIATYYWADGTEKTFTLEKSSTEPGGKGLEARAYKFSAGDAGKVNLNPASSNPVVGVSYTTAKSGSTVNTYEGTLGGSNKGTYFAIERGSFNLDITK
ncbi:hypothetical protein IK112_03715 [Candidatus Saccharibacteria bacterium]|nr:hypothetical protein [Candidatus Saccharibacteria bacterium]